MIEILRKAWLYQYWHDHGQLRFRDSKDLPPASLRMDSPYDPEAHFGNKRSLTWTGYKAHLTESCDAETPDLITHVETTFAGTADVTQTARIHQALEAKQLLPHEHLAIRALSMRGFSCRVRVSMAWNWSGRSARIPVGKPKLLRPSRSPGLW